MQKISNKQKTIVVCASVVAVMLLMCINQFNLFNNDNYWQIVHGRLMLTEGLYPAEEPLSMHKGWSFIYPQWLSILIHTWIFGNLGLSAVNAWYRFVQVVGLFFIWKILRLNREDDSLLPALFAIIVMAAFSADFFATRPFTLSYTLMAFEIYIIEKYVKTDNKKILAFIPLISLIWINIHNSLWAFYLILTAPAIAEWAVMKVFRKKPAFNAISIVIADVIALPFALINPYGINAILYLPRSSATVKLATEWIVELNPGMLTNSGAVPIALLILLAVCFLFSKERRLAPIRYWLLFAGTWYLGMSHIRNVATCIICSVPLIAFYVGPFLPKIKSKVIDKGFVLGLFCFLPAFTIVSLCLYSPKKVDSYLSDHEAITYLCENYDTDVKIYNSINYGGELEYHGYKPYIDCRLEVFAKELNGKDDILKERTDLADGKLYPETFIEKYDFDVYYLTKGDAPALYQYIIHHPDKFKLAFASEDVYIYEAVR